jgi:hypothetical protein
MADKKISELTALTGANVATDDQLVIVDTSAALTKSITIDEFKNALDTATGFVRITGDTMTGNLNMGDNVKAIFGAGSDLQIYHDGAHSYLYETGTGEFRIKTNGNIIQFLDNSNNYLIKATVGAEVGLYFNTAQKLATTSTGVDVKNVASGANAKLNITTESTGGGTSEILFSDNTTGRGRIYYDHGSNPEELHIETTGTDALVIDNSQNVTIPNGNVGIGTSSPTHRLHVVGGTTYLTDHLYIAGGTSKMISSDSVSNPLIFGRNASEDMRIDSSGNVGIGVTSVIGKLHANDSGGATLTLTRTSGATSGNLGKLRFGNTNVDSALASILAIQDGATDNSAITFGTQSSGAAEAEAMRIDSSGHAIIPAGVTLGTSAGVYAAANTLDDYEEGTWTPTASGSTSGTMSINVPRARYIKVGQMVTASATISFTSGSTGVGGLRIFGLPGLPATTSQVNLETHGACMLDAVNFGQTYQTICCYIFSGANYLNLYGTVNNASWEQLQVDPFINGTALQFTAIYQTNN